MTKTAQISNDQMIFSVQELKDKGFSYYKINQMVDQGILIKLNKKYYENGRLEEEMIYIEETDNSISKTYDKNGNILKQISYKNRQLEYEILYKEGKKYSVYKKYYENGQLKEEIFFKEGKKDGPTRIYYENGQLKVEVNYSNDKLSSPYKMYLEDGTRLK